MLAATAAPPSTPRAPPSVKSFCTSMMNSALPMTPPSLVGQVVAALVEAGDERVDRLLRIVAHIAEREHRERERSSVGRLHDAGERVAVVDPARLRQDRSACDGVGAREPAVS